MHKNHFDESHQELRVSCDYNYNDITISINVLIFLCSLPFFFLCLAH